MAEEDILMMVEAGEETGTVDEREHEMIKNIFEFDDRKVSEIMTAPHRCGGRARDGHAAGHRGAAGGKPFLSHPGI